MKTIIHQQQLFSSYRWLNFLESVASALQVNLTLIDTGKGFHFSTPRACPFCYCEYPDLDLEEVKAVSAISGAEIKQHVLSNGRTISFISLHTDYQAALQLCPSCYYEWEPVLDERAGIANKLLSNFLTSLDGELEGGHRTVELSTLRQMNQIVLSLFRRDGCALELAFNLILSSLILLSEAQGSWLTYKKDHETFLIIKGDQTAVNQFLQKGYGSALTEVLDGCIHGTLGVFEPCSIKAGSLLSLMAEECSIAFEIERLFEMLEKKLTSVLGSINNGIILINKYQNITFVNNSAKKLLGKPYLEIVGTKIYQWPGPWLPFINSSECISGYMDSFEEDKNEKYIDWQLNPLSEESCSDGWVILFDDRTDFYRWQKAARDAERLATTGTLVGTLAHELRNPLHAAGGLVQLMSRSPNPEKIRGYSDLILREIDRVTHLLNEFLLLGKPSDVSSTPLNLVQFLYEILPLLEGEAAFYGAELKFTYEPAPEIMADAGQMTQVMLNLVRNAVQETGTKGLVEINVSNSSSHVTLQVRDNGKGIPPAVKEKLFRPFFTTKERGTGLGLSIVKAIVQNHGGEITAFNSPDTGGAVFSIELPVAACKGNQSDVDVLIVVEDELVRHPAEQVIRNTGLRVSSTPDLDTAMKFFDKSSARIIVIEERLWSSPEFQLVSKASPKAFLLVICTNFHRSFEDGIEFLNQHFDLTQLINKVNLLLRYPQE